MIQIILIIALAIMLANERGQRDKAEHRARCAEQLFMQERREEINREKMRLATMTLTEYLDLAEQRIQAAYKSKDHQRKLRAFLRDTNEANGIIYIPHP